MSRSVRSFIVQGRFLRGAALQTGRFLCAAFAGDHARQEDDERADRQGHLVDLHLHDPIVPVVDIREYDERGTVGADVEHIDIRTGQQRRQKYVQEQRDIAADDEYDHAPAEIAQRAAAASGKRDQKADEDQHHMPCQRMEGGKHVLEQYAGGVYERGKPAHEGVGHHKGQHPFADLALLLQV